MARMAGDDDRPPRAETRRGDRPDDICRDTSSAGLRRDRRLCRSACAARQVQPDRHHIDDLPGMGLDVVAGDRIGDAGVLCPRRPRPDHVVAGPADQYIFGADRGDRAGGDRDGAVAVDAVRRCSRDRRRHPLVRGLWRRRRHRSVGHGDCDRVHDRAVPSDRPEPDPAGRANPGGDHRRRLRDRTADCRDPVLRHVVALCGPDIGCDGWLCP